MVIMIVAGVLAVILLPGLAFGKFKPGHQFQRFTDHYHDNPVMRLLNWWVDGGN